MLDIYTAQEALSTYKDYIKKKQDSFKDYVVNKIKTASYHSTYCNVVVSSMEYDYWMKDIIPQLKEKNYRIKVLDKADGIYRIEWGEFVLPKNKILAHFKLRNYL